jgi:FMN phosphatase YigB (HAD superfamily)
MILIFDAYGVVLTFGGLNRRLLDVMAGYRAQGIKVYMGSNMGIIEKTLWWPKLQPHVDGLFCSGELGVEKPDARFYHTIASKLGIVPSDIVFFDDSLTNVAAAKAAGWHAFLYQDVASTQQHITESLKHLS